MSTVTITQESVTRLIENLIGREVTAAPGEPFELHPATSRGLVSDRDVLVAVIGSDLSFAHRAGAALAMIPAGRLADIGSEPDSELLAIYTEVANVLSRLVNEASPTRVRLDPAMPHTDEAFRQVVAEGSELFAYTITIAGYGSGQLGVWWLLDPS
jgi:hypothetical protein